MCSLPIASLMGPGSDGFANVMGPADRQGHGSARKAAGSQIARLMAPPIVRLMGQPMTRIRMVRVRRPRANGPMGWRVASSIRDIAGGDSSPAPTAVRWNTGNAQ